MSSTQGSKVLGFFKAALRGEAPGQGPARKPKTEQGVRARPVPVDELLEASEDQEHDSTPAAGEVPWMRAAEPKGGKFWRSFFRVAGSAVLLFLLWRGFVTVFFPAAAPPAPELPAVSRFDTLAAAGVAERYARAYLTWSEDNAQDRAAALSLDLAGTSSAAQTQQGWDGKGWQAVQQAYTMKVTPQSATQARVTVAVLVTPFTKDAKGAFVAGKGVWEALEVPVEVQNGRAAVTGQPGMVAMPAPSKAGSGTQPAQDSQITQDTRKDAGAFFKAYGSSEDMSALTAPGVTIAGLNGALTFVELRNWDVKQGDGSTRTAAAVVAWKTPSGGVIEQAYTVGLTKVQGGGADRYQISSISGGGPVATH